MKSEGNIIGPKVNLFYYSNHYDSINLESSGICKTESKI